MRLGSSSFSSSRQMPRDRFALAVGVGGEVHLGGRFRGAPQLLDDVALPFNRQVTRGEVVLDVDAERALWEVADVPDRGLDDEAGRQELLDRPRFRRRFDDDQRLGQTLLASFCGPARRPGGRKRPKYTARRQVGRKTDRKSLSAARGIPARLITRARANRKSCIISCCVVRCSKTASTHQSAIVRFSSRPVTGRGGVNGLRFR